MITSDLPAVLELPRDRPLVEALPAPAALEMRRVERSWGKREVLKGVDLTVPHRSVAWLGGPNGAGKTTLLRVAAGILLPDRGTVSLCGLDPERDRRAYYKQLGFLSAGDRGLYARLTVAQNLDVAARLAQVPRRDRSRLIERGVARFELEDLVSRRVDRLSMGQRQRVRLAIAFLPEPSMVLLDEPHTSLDDDGLGLVEAALLECTQRGAAVLWCSPASKSLPLPADCRYFLSDGKVAPA